MHADFSVPSPSEHSSSRSFKCAWRKVVRFIRNGVKRYEYIGVICLNVACVRSRFFGALADGSVNY